jgi:hypothetical protein
MSTPPVDLDSLVQSMAALTGSDLDQVETELRQERDQLQSEVLAGVHADPPQDTSDLANQLALVNTWIRTLNAAAQANPPAGSANDLLNAMQAVDAATATSSGLNSLLVAVNGIVQAM